MIKIWVYSLSYDVVFCVRFCCSLTQDHAHFCPGQGNVTEKHKKNIKHNKSNTKKEAKVTQVIFQQEMNVESYVRTEDFQQKQTN